MNMRISGLCLGTPKNTCDACFALFGAEGSSKFKLITRSFQLEKLLRRRKISILIFLMKGLRNQVASLDLLTASSECRFSCFQSVGIFQPLIDAYN